MGINLAALFLMNCYSADQIDGIEDCLHKVIIRVFAHGDTVLGTVGCTRCGDAYAYFFVLVPLMDPFRQAISYQISSLFQRVSRSASPELLF